MLNLYDELITIIRAFDADGVEYALCGGMAMAIHASPRHTVDIDLLIRPEDLDRAYAVAERCGYTFRARPMSFADGEVEIRRVSKIDPDTRDPLMLDFLLVTPQYEDVWATRQVALIEDGQISVVSREGLVKMKRSRSSGRDLDDIAALQSEAE